MAKERTALQIVNALKKANEGEAFVYLLGIIKDHLQYSDNKPKVTNDTLYYNNGIVHIMGNINNDIIYQLRVTNIYIDDVYKWSLESDRPLSISKLFDYLD